VSRPTTSNHAALAPSLRSRNSQVAPPRDAAPIMIPHDLAIVSSGGRPPTRPDKTASASPAPKRTLHSLRRGSAVDRTTQFPEGHVLLVANRLCAIRNQSGTLRLSAMPSPLPTVVVLPVISLTSFTSLATRRPIRVRTRPRTRVLEDHPMSTPILGRWTRMTTALFAAPGSNVIRGIA
jgi:hypothetical protein